MNDMWQVVSSGGALGLATVFLYLFLSGKIRSEKQLSEAVSVYMSVIEHKDREIDWWRAAYGEQSERGDRQEAINREHMEIAKTALAALKGVHEAAERSQQ